MKISRIEHYEAVRGAEQETSVTERDAGLVQEIIHQSRSLVENLDGSVLLIVPHKSLVGTEPEIAEIIRPGGEENFGRQVFDVFPVVGVELPGVSVIFVETGIETDGPEVAVFVQTDGRNHIRDAVSVPMPCYGIIELVVCEHALAV